MRLSSSSLLLATLITLTTSSAIRTHDLALRRLPRRYSLDDSKTEFSLPSHDLSPRMDQLDPGIVLPGRLWTLVLDQYIPIIGSTVTSAPEATAALRSLYSHSLSTLDSYHTTINKPYILFGGQLLSFMVRQVAGDDSMEVAMLKSFCLYMLNELVHWGAFRGVYVLYLRERVGGNMFQVKMQSNSRWLEQGVAGLPGMVGLAAMGF